MKPAISTASLTGIVVALPEEVATLSSQKLAQGESIRLGKNILLILSGTGPRNAELAAKALIDQGATRLISWGCAAALAPELKPGNLRIPERILSEQGQAISTDPLWQRHALKLLANHLPAAAGSLIESSKIVADSASKRSLYQQTQADALDMESAAVIRVAHHAQLPCIVLRAIADPASMSLPPAVIQALNPQGQVDIKRILQHLLSHPWEVLGLIKLGLHFNAAQKTLKLAAKQLDNLIHFQ